MENFNDKNHLIFKPTKKNKLTKNFHPKNLVEMKKFGIYTLRPGKNEGKIRKIVVEDLKNFQDFCFKKTGKKIPVRSGYRSFYDQQLTFSKYSKDFSAFPGTSEHQLGLAVDFGFHGVFLNPKDFPKLTKCFHENADRFGFVLSYGIGNPNYNYEPWHFRYVGKKYAKIITDSGLKRTPWKFFENPNIYLQKIYKQKFDERIAKKSQEEKIKKINKPVWEEVKKIFSLREEIFAKIFLKRKIVKSIRNGDGEKFRKYSSAYNYLDKILK
ncbi:M15 family metallopeptidase [Candidatus Gracilibacteria bacterium]|nr:M15 family metallopeptidase [Candidatus Gracilibacteria bacterium]